MSCSEDYLKCLLTLMMEVRLRKGKALQNEEGKGSGSVAYYQMRHEIHLSNI